MGSGIDRLSSGAFSINAALSRKPARKRGSWLERPSRCQSARAFACLPHPTIVRSPPSTEISVGNTAKISTGW